MKLVFSILCCQCDFKTNFELQIAVSCTTSASTFSFWYLHMQNPALPVVCLKVKKHVNHKVCCAILICNLLFILANTQTIKKTKLSDQQIRQIAIKVCRARDGACRAKGIFLGTDQFWTETLLQHNKWLNILEKAKFCSCKLHI